MPLLDATEPLLVPTVSGYEVYERVLRQRDEAATLQTVAGMLQGRFVDLATAGALRYWRTSQCAA